MPQIIVTLFTRGTEAVSRGLAAHRSRRSRKGGRYRARTARRS